MKQISFVNSSLQNICGQLYYDVIHRNTALIYFNHRNVTADSQFCHV